MRRRTFFPAIASAAVAAAQSTTPAPIARKGRIKQSCFTRSFGPRMPFDDMFRHAVRLGAAGFDFCPVNQWPALKKFGLIPAVALGGGLTIPTGIVQKQLHDELAKSLDGFIGHCAENGCPNILIPGGQRKGMSYAEGADVAVAFLNRVKARAEEKGVTLGLEVVNSKYQDPVLGRGDAICDHLDWAVEVCTRVNSPRVKILFDIYHIQIMDGNIVSNIRAHLPLIAHVHTAGVPGRHEIDETQELNYPFILKTLADLGYSGYVAHEYDPSPGHDPIQTLEKVFALSDV